MKNKFYILFVILFSNCNFSNAQKSKFEIWQNESKNDIRMIPEYGNVKKSDGQIKADEELIITEVKQAGSREKASNDLVKLGFNYMYRGDLKTGMSRFNQAWLLNPKNEDAFWGFGSIYFMLGDRVEAEKQFQKGLEINPNSSNILTDVATIDFERFANNHVKSDLDVAIKTFEKSYNIDPKNQNTLFKLSALYLYIGDCTNAGKYYQLCIELGGEPITKEYTNAIKQQCKI